MNITTKHLKMLESANNFMVEIDGSKGFGQILFLTTRKEMSILGFIQGPGEIGVVS